MIRLEGQLAATEERLTAMVHRELAALTRTFIIALVGAMVTIAGLAFGPPTWRRRSVHARVAGMVGEPGQRAALPAQHP